MASVRTFRYPFVVLFRFEENRLSDALSMCLRVNPYIDRCVYGLSLARVPLWSTIVKNLIIACGFFSAIFLVTGCEQEGRGFSLPPGNAESGKATFQQLSCGTCHSVKGEDSGETTRKIHVVLGGPTTRVRTYGELVTSVINPSHRIARTNLGEATDESGTSNMKVYNEVMTVQQLVDLVTYLQIKYEVMVPRAHYPAY